MHQNLEVYWDYSGNTGPECWHLLCDRFKKGAEFAYQSPIHLKKQETIAIPTSEKIQFFYQKQKFTEKEFKNTIHFVPFDQLSHLVYHGEKYFLTDIHFHMPSEHVLDEIQAPFRISFGAY